MATMAPTLAPRRTVESDGRIRIRTTWTPKVCKIMAFRAIILGLGLFFYILLGLRYGGQKST